MEYHYARLPESQRPLYAKISAGLAEGKRRIPLPHTRFQTMSEVYEGVVKDHPEYAIVSFLRMDGETGPLGCACKPCYVVGAGERKQAMTVFARECEALLSGLAPYGADAYTIEKALHDRVCRAIAYDHAAAAGAADGKNATAYEVLARKKAVCAGIAMLFKALCDRCGIGCIVVSGMLLKKGQRTEHAWNMVQLGGGWYHVDVTNDLPDASNENRMSHNHFNLNDEDAVYSLEWEYANYPPCKATRDSYFARENRLVGGYGDIERLVGRLASGQAADASFKLHRAFAFAGDEQALWDAVQQAWARAGQSAPLLGRWDADLLVMNVYAEGREE